MGRLVVHQLTFIIVVLIITFTSTICEAKGFEDKVHVRIINDLGPGTDLKVHCKSKDNDLGFHLLHYQGEYGFHFRPNFFRTTLFFCSFQWEGGQVHYFDVYRALTDWREVYDWSVVRDGICNMKDVSPEGCHDWKDKASVDRVIGD
ncbi:hypothetical protein FNV43_RR03310 [Rhamnella rubrinervis]|uniref:S-protein homolog n=1 Tax=Rhamnella rubrinervis TaxID=2594499 RepID=A0A8K0HHS4_9ROSA|nr:hypothetical protein FNV43_RR03310 [Rhamnella rubrinervis]